tara:strand:- start:48603 stop:48827 length:225 start_codon:yes stop_codon:yes gene_type:complete
MSRMTYDLSDGLANLRRSFAERLGAGVFIEPTSIADLASTLGALEERSRLMENEISRHRWNEAARSERGLICLS